MKNYFVLACLLFSVCTFSQQTILFDGNWKFYRGGVLGGQNIDFNDASWRNIDLPHDWSIEDLPGTNSPFNKDAVS